MYTLAFLVTSLLVVALILVHVKPAASSPIGIESFVSGKERFIPVREEPPTVERFSTVAVDEKLMPECVSRSTDAQNLLARIDAYPIGDMDAAELRLLVGKLCCMEADIAAPSAGVYRTLHLQFRTSHDLEPASTLVGRCLRNAVNKRDVELIVEKFSKRGHELIGNLCNDREAYVEFDKVVARLLFAMTSFCFMAQPSMDRPIGVRDMGFWEPANVADLSQYQGVSAEPK